MKVSTLRTSQSTWWWIPCLSGIVAFQFAFIVCLRWIHRQHHLKSIEMAYKQFPELLKHDPPIGSSLVKLISEVNSQYPDFITTHQSLPLLVIVFRSCEGCGEGAVWEWAEVLGKWETWRKEISGVLVFREKPEKVKEAAKKNRWQVTVVADEDGKIAKALNVVFTPRAYGFVDGKLVWLQKQPNRALLVCWKTF